MCIWESVLTLYNSLEFSSYNVNNNCEKDTFVLYNIIILNFPVNRVLKFCLDFYIMYIT